MTRLAKSLIAGTAMATLTLTPAFAGSSSDQSGGSQILNGQVALHTSISDLHTTIDNVGSGVGVQSTAAGNVVDITTMNDTHVTNDQYAAFLNAKAAQVGFVVVSCSFSGNFSSGRYAAVSGGSSR